jgi:hypothetical protein
VGQADHLEDYRVTLNLDQRLDQRTYNVPSTSEVAAVWIEGSELLVSSRIVLSCMEKIEAELAFAHIMDVMMLFHTLYSSLMVSLGGTWIFQRKELVWKKSSSIMPYRRLVVGQMKK